MPRHHLRYNSRHLLKKRRRPDILPFCDNIRSAAFVLENETMVATSCCFNSYEGLCATKIVSISKSNAVFFYKYYCFLIIRTIG